MITRRGFLGGMAGILVAQQAPSLIYNPMKIWTPPVGRILTLENGFSYSDLETYLSKCWDLLPSAHERVIYKNTVYALKRNENGQNTNWEKMLGDRTILLG